MTDYFDTLDAHVARTEIMRKRDRARACAEYIDRQLRAALNRYRAPDAVLVVTSCDVRFVL